MILTLIPSSCWSSQPHRVAQHADPADPVNDLCLAQAGRQRSRTRPASEAVVATTVFSSPGVHSGAEKGTGHVVGPTLAGTHDNQNPTRRGVTSIAVGFPSSATISRQQRSVFDHSGVRSLVEDANDSYRVANHSVEHTVIPDHEHPVRSASVLIDVTKKREQRQTMERIVEVFQIAIGSDLAMRFQPVDKDLSNVGLCPCSEIKSHAGCGP